MSDSYKGFFRWILPTVIFIIFVLVSFGTNLSKYHEQASLNAYSESMRTVASDAADIRRNLNGLVSGAQTVKELLVGHPDYSHEDLADAVWKSCGAYEAVICDDSGKGIDHVGNAVDLSGMDYFSSLFSARNDYTYVHEDVLTSSADGAVIYHDHFDDMNGGKLAVLLFYKEVRVLGDVDTSSVVGSPEYIISDSNGKVLISKASSLGYGDDLWVAIKPQMKPAAFENFKRNVESGRKANYAEMYTSNGQERVIFSCPMGVSDWNYTVTMEKEYVTSRVDRSFASLRSMMLEVIIVFIVFTLFMSLMFLLSRAKTKAEGEAAEERAETDLLTGMYNKVSTEMKIKEQIRTKPDEKGVFVIFDIDDFKRINDTMGHAFGDEVLSEVGRNIRGLYRSSDIYGRVGGDEFMVFIKNLDDTDTMINQVHRIEEFFHTFRVGTYTKYSPTASVGVAIFPKNGADFETLYKEADSALYESKRGGKNQIHFADAEVQARYEELYGSH